MRSDAYGDIPSLEDEEANAVVVQDVSDEAAQTRDLSVLEDTNSVPTRFNPVLIKATYLLLPLLALLTTISPVIFSQYVLNNTEQEPTPLEKLAIPMGIWLFAALPTLWLQWHLNGRRITGEVDLPAQVSNPNFHDDPVHLVLAAVASLPPFFNGVVAAMLLNADKSLPRFVVSSLVLGSLNWLTWTMTTLQATWRKYVEGTTIKALSEQPGAKLYYRNSRTLKILLREIYPPIIAVLHARLFDQAAQQVLSGLPPLGVKVISTLLAMLVYQATALSTRNFDIRQMKDCAEAAESTFVLDGLLASSSFTALRWLGKGINGQLLTDILHKVSLSLTASGRIVMGLNALGVSAVIHQAFATFASGSDTSVLSFYLAEAQAAKVAKQLIPLSIGLSILLPALQCRARFATVLDQIKLDSEVPRRSVSAIGVTELS